MWVILSMEYGPPHIPFTPEFLREMTAGNEELMKMVLQTFIDQSERLLTELESYANAGDEKGLQAHFHKLSGSAKTIGADAFGDLSKEFELRYAEDCGQKDSKVEVEKLKDAYGLLKSELKDYLN